MTTRSSARDIPSREGASSETVAVMVTRSFSQKPNRKTRV
jgi:hypothetical protein